MSAPVTVTVLGSRGSIPVCGAAYSRYGGATCCVLVRGANQAILLDAGSGLLNASRHLEQEREFILLLTHAHLDHVMGLTLCPEVLKKDRLFHIYGVVRNGLDVRAQLAALLSPPLWPVCAEQLPAQLLFHDLNPHLDGEHFTVDCMEGSHPGGVSVLRLTLHGRRIVFMTDCTITEDNHGKLLEFCRDCDLLLCDGQYSEEEWPARSSFGHNSWMQAARFGRDCGAKQIRLLHHDPTHTDDILDLARAQVQTICPRCELAYDGEELSV